ncbi:MAG: tetratricopeptide repeat protein, partial [Myxococcales bacterium]|nr:tetratricopeptide repeat protein [Myxococcales bacterium]
VARSKILRAQIYALDLGDAQEAERWLEAGEAGYRSLGGFGDAEPEVHEARGLVALAQEKPSEAIEHYRQAIDALPEGLAAKPREAKLLVNIGAAMHELGDYDGAEKIYEEAIARVSEALGANHPEARARRGHALFNLGIAAIERGDEARGVAIIAELEKNVEPELAIQVQVSLLTAIIADESRVEEMRLRADQLATMLERPTSLPLRIRAEAETVLGQVYAILEDERTLVYLERALGDWERVADPGFHRDLVELNYAQVLAGAGRVDEAKQHVLALLVRFDGGTLPQIREGTVALAEALQLGASQHP